MMLLSREKLSTKILYRIKRSIYKFLTKNSPDMYFRNNDIITYSTVLKGHWENDLNQLIKNYSKIGFSDFLIDIGANIGLSSCQNKDIFKYFYCIEPNPICSKILEANLILNLKKNNYEIFPFAITNKDKITNLYIPKKNFGGGFIKDGNPYSTNKLIKKEGINNFELDDYIIKRIKNRNGSEFFKELFNKIIFNKYKKGFVKIDVEGFEIKIIEYIASIIPKYISLIIVFENWDEDLNFIKLKKKFDKHDIKFSYIKTSIFKDNKFLKREKKINLQDTYRQVSFEESEKNIIGHLVIEVIEKN